MRFVASHTLCFGPWFSFRVSLFLFSGWGHYYHGTQAVIMHELMILSYHLLPEFILFTHKLEPVTSLLCCVCCFLVCLVLVLCVFVFLFFPNSRMLWGLSPHSLRGAPGHCSTLPPRFAGSGNQGSENRFREPGFGARLREPRVPGTRVRGKVPGTQGSANQTFKQGSGNNGFWLPFGFRDVKVPGRFRAHLAFDKVPGTLPWFRAARAWIVPKFWNHRNTNFETSCKPRVWGARILARFQQHWVPTRFREPPQMRTHSLDILPGLCHRFRTGTRSEFWQGSEVPETTQGSDIRRGLYQGSCYGQGPRKPICKETKVPGPKGPGQRAIADRGGTA